MENSVKFSRVRELSLFDFGENCLPSKWRLYFAPSRKINHRNGYCRRAADTQVVRKISRPVGHFQHCQYFCWGTNKVFTLKYLLLKPSKALVVLTINYLTFQCFSFLGCWCRFDAGMSKLNFLTLVIVFWGEMGSLVILVAHKLIIAEIFTEILAFLIRLWVIWSTRFVVSLWYFWLSGSFLIRGFAGK
jgi:hypothetical protein